MNSQSEEFGAERLMDVVRRSRALGAREIVQAIVQAVADHRAGFPRNDDLTVVALKITSA
jgi:serine phosphatase RsbU (regulator of sigma subunit)